MSQVAPAGVDAAVITDTARAVLAQPTPSGAERACAERLVRWGRTAAPELNWAYQDVADGRANLFAWTGPRDWTATGGVWLYAHLDHSLAGRPGDDLPLTGWPAPPTDPVITDDLVRGLGVAVARGPAIAALAAARVLATAARESGRELPFGVVLTAGGTHRSLAPTPFDTTAIDRETADPTGLATGLGVGVRAALHSGWRPGAVINVKGGADGVLSAEPGFLMVQVQWRGPFVALPARGDAPGAAVVAGHLALAVEDWREQYRAGVAGGSTAGGQLAADLCVGAVHSGLSYKPDLQPGYAAVEVYLSTLDGQDVETTIGLLDAHLRRRLTAAGVDVAGEALSVTAYAQHAAAATAEVEPVVVAARRVWEHDGRVSRVEGYRGSTDGNLFRVAGIPTVRFGPTARPCPDDPTCEQLGVAELVRFGRSYVDTVLACSSATTATGASQ